MTALPNSVDLAAALGPEASGAVVLAGPTRVGNERRWQLRLADGRAAVLAQLVEELANDECVRRRYRRDVERLAALDLQDVAPLITWGPAQDDGPPWRLRPHAPGQTLEAWLETRAPAPADEVAAILATLCDRLARLHDLGMVIRDLSPAKIALTDEGPVFVDIGLARVDILSTRTAASLVLEGSPYTAPELLMRTAVDGRADLYGVGVLAFRALTGQLPFPDTHALLRPVGPSPRPRSIQPEVPEPIDALVASLLDADPTARPRAAGLVADVLRGQAQLGALVPGQSSCQSCGAAMPLGQRLCTACGKLAVQFRHAGPETDPNTRVKLVLRKVKEDAEPMAALQQLSAELCEGQAPALNFVVGDARMYSKQEIERRIPLPCTLFNDLDPDTAARIQQRYAAKGIELKIVELDAQDRGEGAGALTRGQRRTGVVLGGVAVLAAGAALVVGAPAIVVIPSLLLGGAALGGLLLHGFRKANRKRLERWGRSLMCLRAGPTALPASDPLVARLSALIQDQPAADLRQLLGELALIVQRLVDHRASNQGEAAQIDMATEPVGALVSQIERRVALINAIDAELAELDEGLLVRGLAAAKAREEPDAAQVKLLDGLDRLRELEVRRAQSVTAILAAADLMRRAVELGLAVHDAEQEHERHVRAAMLALGAAAEPES
ncbi:serine/threonine-protein kinase [Enhygromyxa salina]|uniref:Serine/threonine-protein kinase PknB n=1 Tax=Enhygromyxa salina TaxID=215803 RepID=A0A2S9XQT4_9BACT|nr:protein kinase [Enhygromyxa salina]PRP95223.1 Serine/threonine-protein kinase PknB [Enhygromyxa salina]